MAVVLYKRDSEKFKDEAPSQPSDPAERKKTYTMGYEFDKR